MGSDIFTLRDKNYLILVDYYSNFIKVVKLENLMSKTVIKKSKVHYATYGVPNTLISDNRLQYASKELTHFAETYFVKDLSFYLKTIKFNGLLCCLQLYMYRVSCNLNTLYITFRSIQTPSWEPHKATQVGPSIS